MLRVYCSIILLILNPILGDRFAIELIKKFSSYRKGNFVISPLLVSHSLTQLYLANDDKVDMELRKALRLKTDDVKSNVKYFRDYYARALTADFKIATRLYIPADLSTTARYESICNRINASVESIDFSKPAKAALEINLWLSQALNRNFSDLLHDDEVSSKTDLVSISGTSFRPNWKYPFFSRWKKPFTVKPLEGKSYVVFVNTMYTSARFATFDEKNAMGIFLPLQRTSLGMLIIMPKKQSTPRKILQNIGFFFHLKLKTYRNLSLFLPIFRIIMGTELSVLLKRMGIKQLFEGFKYDEAFDTDSPLSVDSFKTKAVVEVQSDKPLIEIEDPADEDDSIFEVNRSFVFLIKDKNRIYAAGRVESLDDLYV